VKLFCRTAQVRTNEKMIVGRSEEKDALPSRGWNWLSKPAADLAWRRCRKAARGKELVVKVCCSLD